MNAERKAAIVFFIIGTAAGGFALTQPPDRISDLCAGLIVFATWATALIALSSAPKVKVKDEFL